MLKVVFDSNVYIAAYVISGSKSEEAFILASKGRFNLFVSPIIVAEIANKLRKKFGASDAEAQQFVRQIAKVATVLSSRVTVRTLSDDPDNRILECAVAAKADLIVTGDKHLLKLKQFRGIGIARVADLLRVVGE